MSLRASIKSLAEQFAARVVAELARASIGDLSKFAGGAAPPTSSAAPAAPPARRRRRAAPVSRDTTATIDAIVDALRSAGAKGMRNEHLQASLRMTSAQLQRPLQDAITSRHVRKTGQRRGTTYFAS